MRIQLKHHAPSGEIRAWTFKEIVQGKPLDRPTHPMVVHFPIAFYYGALALDILSRAGGFAAAPLAATWLIVGAFAGTLLAAATGLADRATMRPGSRVRAKANLHLGIQLTATAVFVLNLIVRWSDRHVPHARPLWIALDAIGVLAVSVGADFGGQMVDKVGFR